MKNFSFSLVGFVCNFMDCMVVGVGCTWWRWDFCLCCSMGLPWALCASIRGFGVYVFVSGSLCEEFFIFLVGFVCNFMNCMVVGDGIW